MHLKERMANIELIRICAVIGVICMHYLNPKMGGLLKLIQDGGVDIHYA